MRFIAGIKGRDGVEDATTRLELIPLHKRRRGQQLKLLMRILAKEEHHSSLSESYNEIMSLPAMTMKTRSITDMWDPSYQHSVPQQFSPRTIREIKGQNEQTTVSYSSANTTGLTNTYC